METNLRLSQSSYTDYDAALYFNACQIKNVKFTPKIVEVDGVKVILMHVEGTQTTTGVKVNLDMWPRDNATEAEVAKFEKISSLTDIEFRVGYFSEMNSNGEISLRQGLPKWTTYCTGGDFKPLSGGKREFAGE